jgi:hypothetical protein
MADLHNGDEFEIPDPQDEGDALDIDVDDDSQPVRFYVQPSFTVC